VLLATSAPAGAADPADDDVLAHVRRAVGFEKLTARGGGVLVEGKVRHRGLDTTFSLLFTPAGEFVERIAGRLTESNGFDGTTL
jgi:hypothetical protein